MPVLPSTAPETVAQALKQGIAQGLAPMDAQLLLLHALDRTEAGRSWLLAHDDYILQAAEQQRWQQLVQRRLQGEQH